MANLESHIDGFITEQQRHLHDTRMLRRNAMSDTKLDKLPQAVLGVSGSAEVLDRYRELIGYIGHVVGEPIIKVHTNDNKSYISKGGIISGEAIVESHPYEDDQELGRGSAALFVYAPIEAMSTVHHWSNRVYTGEDSELGRERRIEVAHILNHEWENDTLDPARDIQESYPRDKGTILIGRSSIYKSPLLHTGVYRTLLSIEQEAANLSAPVNA